MENEAILGPLFIALGMFLLLFGWARYLDSLAERSINDTYKDFKKPIKESDLTGLISYKKRYNGMTIYCQYKKNNKTLWRKATQEDIKLLKRCKVL